MKPSYGTYGQIYDLYPDGRTYHQGQSTLMLQQISGVNNHKLRPVSPYKAKYINTEYGISSTSYKENGDVRFWREGPMNESIWVKWDLIRNGSMREARNRLHSQFLNATMLARDLYDANKMACSYFKRVNNCIKFLRKRKFKDAYNAFMGNKRTSLGIANNWLEFQFGVMPTIRAVQDSYAAYSAARTVYGYNVLRMTSSSKLIKTSGGSADYIVYTPGKDYTDFRCIRYFTRESFFDSMFRVNPVEAAWDMIPYSFLVDWFVPVGDWLKQFGYIQQYATIGCDTTYNRRATRGYGISYYDRQRRKPMTVWHNNSSTVSLERVVNNLVDYDLSLSEMMNNSSLGISCKRTITSLALARQRCQSIKW